MTADFEAFKFNTAVATMMEYLNELQAWQSEGSIRAEAWRAALETFTQLVAPICPFITEEVWREVLGHSDSVHRSDWPAYDPSMLAMDEVEVVIQVNGKVRDRMTVSADIDETTLKETVMRQERVQQYVNGKIRRFIYVPPGLVNIVVG